MRCARCRDRFKLVVKLQFRSDLFRVGILLIYCQVVKHGSKLCLNVSIATLLLLVNTRPVAPHVYHATRFVLYGFYRLRVGYLRGIRVMLMSLIPLKLEGLSWSKMRSVVAFNMKI